MAPSRPRLKFTGRPITFPRLPLPVAVPRETLAEYFPPACSMPGSECGAPSDEETNPLQPHRCSRLRPLRHSWHPPWTNRAALDLSLPEAAQKVQGAGPPMVHGLSSGGLWNWPHKGERPSNEAVSHAPRPRGEECGNNHPRHPRKPRTQSTPSLPLPSVPSAGAGPA